MNINAALLVGKQSVAGTVASSLTAIPVTDFSSGLKKEVNQPDEFRNSQESTYTVVPGNRWQEWEATGEAYYDTLPFILLSAFGAPTSNTASGATTHTFKAQDNPPLLSLQWIVAAIQSFQSLDAVVDEFSLKFAADGDGMVEWSAKGLALPETTISTPTPTYSTVLPFKSWQASVTLGGGAYARLLSMEITWKRNRSAFWVVGGGVSPNRFNAGARSCDVKLELDFTNTTDYVAAKAMTEQAFVVTFTDTSTTIGTGQNPAMTLNLPKLVYTGHELDWGGDTPSLGVEGVAKYDAASGTAFYMTIKNATASY